MRRVVAAALAAALLSCAPTPRPRVLSQADVVARSAAALEAKALAPQAYAQAELVEKRAARAFDDDDVAGSQILGEHAIAAYTHAFVLARVAKAGRRLAEAKSRLVDADKRLAELDAKVASVTADADALEMRVKVAQDALPLVPNGPATPDREHARLEAARELALEGRLLCVSAKLLGAKGDALDHATADLDTLDKALGKQAKAAPIDDAIKVRSACLSVLTATRRTATLQAPAAGVSDALLAELGQLGGLHPYRDDRGVVVTLRGVLGAGDRPTTSAAALLAKLGRVAKAHPGFPVLVVMHSSQGAATARDSKRAAAVADALRAAGAATVESQAAGGVQPLVDPGQAGAAARNERVEIVFVAPAS